MKTGVTNVSPIESCSFGDEMDREISITLYTTGKAVVSFFDWIEPIQDYSDRWAIETDIHEMRYVRDTLSKMIERMESGNLSDEIRDEE